jgi:hypothetical protein
MPLISYRMKGRRKKDPGSATSVQWPSAEAWLPVVEEALRAAHAVHCVAMALRGRPGMEDTVRFLTRRGDMLIRFVESLVTESRCGDRFQDMSTDELLKGMKHIETSLTSKVRQLLGRTGQKRQVTTILENEALIGQISQTRIQLALMEPDKAPDE